MAASETLTVTIPSETRRELEEYARQTEQSSASVIREAIEAHLADRRAYLAAIEEAVEEADRTGEFVSWEAVKDWMNSWGTKDELPVPKPDIFTKRG